MIDLKKLEEMLDQSLKKETRLSLTWWFLKQRIKQFFNK
jgi:hypothetical protein